MSVALPDFLLPEDIKFYLSGGTNNTDPIFSIGGPISNTEIINNILHNLFDRVETKEATEGDQEWRCFYIKNTHPKETLAGTKIWIESGTSSSKTYISLGIGAAGINQQEILIPNENTDPAIVSFSIPLEPPETPNIGDLGPGDHVGIWIRYTVQEGAEERAEDTAILRIEGERVPIQAFFPPIACPTNTHFDPNTNTCVPLTTIPECPAGFHYDETVQNCVLDNTPPITCPAGTHYDPNTAACIPINQTPTCPTGFHYDESIQNCVPDGGAPPAVSLFNIGIAGDWSCNNDAEDTMNNIADFIGNTGILIALGDLSYVDGDESCWIQLTEDIFPAQFPNNIYPAIGNHDDSEDGAASDRDEIIDAYPAIPSQGYYSFTKGNIRFIIMDTQSSYGTGSSQYQFVSNELRMADADPSIMWIIVGYHKPSIVPDTDHGAETGVRDAYHPLFDQYHVDMICSGHNHNYSRSKPIKFNSSSPNSPTVMSNATTGYIDVDGRIFITVGTAGQSSLDNINDNPAWMAASNDSDRGALLVSLTETVSGRGNQLNCRFRTNNGDDDDVFTITKSASPNPPPGGGGGSGGGGNPPPSGGGVGVDSNGILWMYATGAQSVVEQSRFDSNDFRWSEVYDNIAGGYESTLYFTFDGVASDGHCASKMWGGNHSGDCQYTEGGDCCCWYDLGIRADGEVQLQTERPHPSNHDFSLPSNQLPISDIGVSMDGRTIGLKWLIYPVKIGGDVEDGGIRIKMWVDTSGFQNNRPQNVWRLCIDMLDTGSILGDMPALDEQEIEIRNSDTDDTNDYAGGVHVRYLRRPQDIP